MRANVVEIPGETVSVRKDRFRRNEVFAVLEDGSTFILTVGTTPSMDATRKLAQKEYDDEYRINSIINKPTPRRGFGPSVEFDLVKPDIWTLTEAGGVYTEVLNREARKATI
jgi:hypothetical protein